MRINKNIIILFVFLVDGCTTTAKRIEDCNSQTVNDRYPIKKPHAIEIARSNGWVEIASEWAVERSWNNQTEKCVWNLTRIEGSILNGWHGQVMAMDATSGLIINQTRWYKIQ